MTTRIYDVHAIDRNHLSAAIVEAGGDRAHITKRKKVCGWEIYEVTESTGILYGETAMVVIGDAKEADTIRSKLERKLGVKLIKPNM